MTSATVLHSEDLFTEGKELVSLKGLGEEAANHSVGGFVLEKYLLTLDPAGNEEVSDVDVRGAFSGSCSAVGCEHHGTKIILVKDISIDLETL